MDAYRQEEILTNDYDFFKVNKITTKFLTCLNSVSKKQSSMYC